jgi:AraC family transcriptional regulator
MTKATATTQSIPTGELFEVLPEAPIASSKPQSWNHIVAEYYHHRPNSLASPLLQNHLITLNCGRSYSLVQRLDGRVHEGRVVKGNIIFTPAGQSTEWTWQNEVDVLHLSLEPGFLATIAAEVLEMDLDRVDLIYGFSISDPMIEQVGQALLSELLSESPSGRLYTESLTNVLAVHLLKQHSSANRSPKQPCSGLPPYKLQRAIDYIHDRLEEALTLAEIAEAVDMSPYYFARQFKQSTGVAPYQYLTERRIERAKALLSGTDESIAEIGLRLGFTNQSHFTAQFRKLTGMTPRSFRQSL